MPSGLGAFAPNPNVDKSRPHFAWEDPATYGGSMDIIYPTKQGTPSFVPGGWGLFESSLTPELMQYVDYSRVGAAPGASQTGDYGVFGYDPNNPANLMKLGKSLWGSPGTGGNQGVVGDFIPDYNIQNQADFATGKGDAGPWTQMLISQRFPDTNSGMNKWARDWMPGITAGVLGAISGGAGALALGGTAAGAAAGGLAAGSGVGATAGGAIGGAVAGGLMNAPKTMRGEGLAPLAAGMISGAAAGAAAGPGLAGAGAGAASESSALSNFMEFMGKRALNKGLSMGIKELLGGQTSSIPKSAIEYNQAAPQDMGGYANDLLSVQSPQRMGKYNPWLPTNVLDILRRG